MRRPYPYDPSQKINGVPLRYVQCLAGFARGLSRDEIGAELYLSPDTIKTHCRRLFALLDVHTQAQAVAVAIELGIIRPRRVVSAVPVRLTAHERQCLEGLARGHTYVTLGADLGVSPDTLKSRTHYAFARLGARTQAQAVAAAYRYGVLRPGTARPEQVAA